MQFQVPQFIEIEDKLFGPFTFRQFVYLAGGAAGCFIIYRFLPTFLAYPAIALFGGMALLLAFYKVNNRPFIYTLESGLKYYLSPKLYKWKKAPAQQKIEVAEPTAETRKLLIPRTTASKLKDLAWSLDIQDKAKKE